MTTFTPDEERVDVARAARQGMDVSSIPREERCKYPSKFCGNARASKSSGKLHRFCEFHRQRANVNQKRWTKVRRIHKHDMNMVPHVMAPSVTTTWPTQWSDFNLLPTSPTDSISLPSQLNIQPGYYLPGIHQALAPRVDVPQTTSGLLSTEELYILMSFLLSNESAEDAVLVERSAAFPLDLATSTHCLIPKEEFGHTSAGVLEPATIDTL